MAPPDPASIPEVGIWWLWRGRLLKSSVPYPEGTRYDRHVNGTEDHYSFWPRLQAVHTELRGLEYEEVPRGRVIYDTAARRTYCYTRRALTRDAGLRQLVIEGFNCDPRRTVFRQDDHYEDPGLFFGDGD